MDWYLHNPRACFMPCKAWCAAQFLRLAGKALAWSLLQGQITLTLFLTLSLSLSVSLFPLFCAFHSKPGVSRRHTCQRWPKSTVERSALHKISCLVILMSLSVRLLCACRWKGMTREVAIRELVAKSGYAGPCQACAVTWASI